MTSERLRLRLALVLTGWTLGLVQAVLHAAMFTARGTPNRWELVGWNWLCYGIVALLLPWVVERALATPFERDRWLRQIPAHIGRAAVAAILEAALYGAIRQVVELAGGSPYDMGRLGLALLDGVFLSNLYLFAAASIAASAVQGALRLQEKNVAAAKLESELASTRLRLIKAQLNPHFLFNTLHTVSSLVNRDPAAANRTISRLSDFLRVLLETSGQEQVTLEQELEHLRLYVRIQETRFRDRLVFEVEVPDEFLRVLLPHLILQPLVENSIEHGSSPRAVLTVWVRARRVGEWVEVAVDDDGRGPLLAAVSRSGHHGVGLASARVRLQTLYGEVQAVEAEPRPGGGSTVRFRVPWRLAPADPCAVPDPMGETSPRLDVPATGSASGHRS